MVNQGIHSKQERKDTSFASLRVNAAQLVPRFMFVDYMKVSIVFVERIRLTLRRIRHRVYIFMPGYIIEPRRGARQ